MVPEIVSIIVGTGLLAGLYKMGYRLGKIDTKLGSLCDKMGIMKDELQDHEGRLRWTEEVIRNATKRREG
jgi:hypothetical protein